MSFSVNLLNYRHRFSNSA